MDYKKAIEIFDTLDDNDKAKEVYAHFGLAIYYSQVLEMQLINMIVAEKLNRRGKFTPDEVDALFDNYNFGKRTLGVLISELKGSYNLSDDEQKELTEVLKLRNYLAHDYFKFNSELHHSDNGRKRMIKDFVEFRERAKSLDNKLMAHARVYNDKVGLTDERMAELMEEVKQEFLQKNVDENFKTIHK